MDPVEKIPKIDPVEAVEKILKYSFSNKSLLKDALLFSREKPETARVQFLGEAALAQAFTNHLFLAYPNLEPKELTDLRSSNVNGEKFARAAVNHGLFQFIIGDVDTHTATRVKNFTEAVRKEDDPGPYALGRSRIVKATPAILGDIVESVAGAVYIDVNYDVRRLWEICRGIFEPIYTFDDMRRQPQIIATLYRIAEKYGKRVQIRQSQGADGLFKVAVYLDDEFIAGGVPKPTAKQAKLAAARDALSKLSESMVIEMVMDDDNLDIDIDDARKKLIEICKKRKWPCPTYKVWNRNNQGYACSVSIETTGEEETLSIMGERRKRKNISQDAAASLMIRALKYVYKDDL
ncbi:hypothetical protein EUTSA_v10000947mg [Eutrema salsugineum]|uniref:RNase III domain-containing protein n=1 Tax=Eutrema salsugineum TaxID=72664 RepID=V4LIL5_EUTSA|nr:ribonuclease 3-like protein 3 [Eutrema salsugineum]ESQ39618.1 hypothetical protein EUTSA_v10000947mg [Eutrema salsugineum]